MKRTIHTLDDKTKNLALRQVLSVTKPHFFPSIKQWGQLFNVLTKFEKRLFGFSFLIILLCLLSLGVSYIITHGILIPTVGGEYTEALVGDPRLINPIYSSMNDVDADLVRLTFSGLVKWKDGKIVNDLTEKIDVNANQTEYTFKIKSNAKFSNNDPVQARDVVFTINAIQNPSFRSPLQNDFKNVTVEQVDDQTVSFTLNKADPMFLQNLTVGILPESVWSDINPQNAPLASWNLQPIGSGPYVFHSLTKDKNGTIRSYTLERNRHFYDNTANINELTFKFFADENSAIQALNNKTVEGIGLVDSNHQDIVESNRNISFLSSLAPMQTLLFFNEQNPSLNISSVRLAISEAIQKDMIVKDVLHGHATVSNGPLMIGTEGYDSSFSGVSFDKTNAEKLLDNSGFTKPEGSQFRNIPATKKQVIKKSKKNIVVTEPEPPKQFSLSLVVNDDVQLGNVATQIKNQLEAIGISISIKIVPEEKMTSDVMGTSSYDLLLVTSYTDTDFNPYLFWHSSQAFKNGLNVSKYINKQADSLLDKWSSTSNISDRESIARQFQTVVVKDSPAVFLYQSSFVHALAKKIHFEKTSFERNPSDRFANITDWYIKTKNTLK